MLYKLIQRGQWTAAEMEKRSTMEELMEVLSALKPEIDFTKETELIDEGLLESFDVITLIAELEDQFGVEIPAERSYRRTLTPQRVSGDYWRE